MGFVYPAAKSHIFVLVLVCVCVCVCVCSHGSIGAIHCYKEICLCVVVHNVCPFEVVMVSLFKGSGYCYCWFVLQPRLVLN